MSSTGFICTQSGIYRSACPHKIEIALSKGERFPPCRDCGNVSWTLIRATNN